MITQIVFIVLGAFCLFIGIALYVMLPPPGYTHNPATGFFRGIFIMICVLGVLFLGAGIIPVIIDWIFGGQISILLNNT